MASPSGFQALWQQAHRHAERREWDQAKACFNAILAERPDDPAVLTQLSYICSLAGQYRAARAAALRASTHPGPMPPAVLKQLLPRLRTFNEAEAFHRLLVKALRRVDPGDCQRLFG